MEKQGFPAESGMRNGPRDAQMDDIYEVQYSYIYPTPYIFPTSRVGRYMLMLSDLELLTCHVWKRQKWAQLLYSVVNITHAQLFRKYLNTGRWYEVAIGYSKSKDSLCSSTAQEEKKKGSWLIHKLALISTCGLVPRTFLPTSRYISYPFISSIVGFFFSSMNMVDEWNVSMVSRRVEF